MLGAERATGPSTKRGNKLREARPRSAGFPHTRLSNPGLQGFHVKTHVTNETQTQASASDTDICSLKG